MGHALFCKKSSYPRPGLCMKKNGHLHDSAVQKIIFGSGFLSCDLTLFRQTEKSFSRESCQVHCIHVNQTIFFKDFIFLIHLKKYKSWIPKSTSVQCFVEQLKTITIQSQTLGFYNRGATEATRAAEQAETTITRRRHSRTGLTPYMILYFLNCVACMKKMTSKFGNDIHSVLERI